MFDTVEYQDLSGNLSQNDLYGYTFYRINDIKELSRENISLEDIIDISNQLEYKYEQSFQKSNDLNADSYDFV